MTIDALPGRAALCGLACGAAFGICTPVEYPGTKIVLARDDYGKLQRTT